jgi:hypothetical protein
MLFCLLSHDPQTFSGAGVPDSGFPGKAAPLSKRSNGKKGRNFTFILGKHRNILF